MSDLNDSELIALYHKGKLDGESMNQLERRALNDLFLADALEGFSQVKKPHPLIRKDLRKRLEKRLRKNKRRSITGQTSAWAAAAAIVLAVGATWFWFHEEKENRMAQNEMIIPPSSVRRNDTVKAAVVAKSPAIASAPQKKEVAKSASRSRIKTQPAIKELPDSVMLGEVASVIYEKAPEKNTRTLADNVWMKPDSDQIQQTEPVLVKGKVISANDGKALPGVNLILQGKNKSVVTDAKGEFTLAAEQKDVVNANYAGYKRLEKKVGENSSMLIAMQPNNPSQSEITVTDYGTQNLLKKAQPTGGWKNYHDYLKEKAVTYDGTKGTVVLGFSVDTNGKIGDLIIVKSYSEKASERAKDILKNGPAWQHASAQNMPEHIRLNIRFAPVKPN